MATVSTILSNTSNSDEYVIHGQFTSHKTFTAIKLRIDRWSYLLTNWSFNTSSKYSNKQTGQFRAQTRFKSRHTFTSLGITIYYLGSTQSFRVQNNSLVQASCSHFTVQVSRPIDCCNTRSSQQQA